MTSLFEKGPPELSEHDSPNVNEFENMEELGVDADAKRDQSDDEPDWIVLARDAMNFSTGYLDANYRKKWEDGIRAFNNQHPLDSKYNNPSYSKRSNLYRPKIRAAIRKNEAAAAAAFFSNMEVVNVGAVQQGDPMQRASAEVMKHLLQYRLASGDPTVSVPWYLMTLGALQDAQTVGVCVSRQYWDQEADKPGIKLIAIENLRIDPAAEWFDPIGTSPYIIELIPMYVGDILAEVENGFFNEISQGELQSLASQTFDSTRMVRQKGRTDPTDASAQPVSDYDVCWVERHIHRHRGQDYVFYKIGDDTLLTDPKPLEEEVFHGERDYVMGICILETHKIMPSGVAELARPLSDETNEITNQRMDNVKFVLNKGFFVRRGKNVDVASLVRNVPGRVTMMDDPEKDVVENNWPDVTQSSFEEQNRLTADFSDLIGDFSPANAQLSRHGKEPARVMQLMAQSGTPLTEYLLRTFTVTWVEPVLRQIIKLEQQYETDTVVLAIAADRAKLLQKFGMNQVTDELLTQSLTLTVNVGMGATDPLAKLQKFNQGLLTLGQIFAAKIPGLNMQEVSSESFALMGYQDGKRFLAEDPQVVQMKQAMQAKDQAIQELTKQLSDKRQDNVTKLQVQKDKSRTAIATTVLKHEHANKHKVADFVMDMAKGEAQASTEKADAA